MQDAICLSGKSFTSQNPLLDRFIEYNCINARSELLRFLRSAVKIVKDK